MTEPLSPGNHHFCYRCVRACAGELFELDQAGLIFHHDGNALLRVPAEQCERCDAPDGDYLIRALPAPTSPPDTEKSPPPEPTEFPPPPKLPTIDPADVPTEPDASPEPFPLPDEDPPPLKVFTGDAASLTRDKRPWYDYGKDTGPRLRVKGLVDRPGPPAPDPEERKSWLKKHEQYKRARAEGDDHAVGKLMEPIMDALHTETPPVPVHELDWNEMEPAILAELKEWARAVGVKPRNLAFKRYFGDNVCVRVVFGKFDQDSAIYEARIDGLKCRLTWKRAKGNARAAADDLAGQIAREFMKARAADCITVPDPELLGGG